MGYCGPGTLSDGTPARSEHRNKTHKYPGKKEEHEHASVDVAE